MGTELQGFLHGHVAARFGCPTCPRLFAFHPLGALTRLAPVCALAQKLSLSVYYDSEQGTRDAGRTSADVSRPRGLLQCPSGQPTITPLFACPLGSFSWLCLPCFSPLPLRLLRVCPSYAVWSTTVPTILACGSVRAFHGPESISTLPDVPRSQSEWHGTGCLWLLSKPRHAGMYNKKEREKVYVALGKQPATRTRKKQVSTGFV